MLRLWEYGVGDAVRQSTFASVRRVEANVFEVTGDAGLSLGLRAKALAASSDRTTWAPLAAKAEGGLLVAEIPVAKLAGPLYVRLER